jgi:hypothetical protein
MISHMFRRIWDALLRFIRTHQWWDVSCWA